MKPIIPFLAMFLLLNACERQQGYGPSPIASTASKLPGVWVARSVSPHGTSIESTLEIARDGSFTSASTFHTRSNGVHHLESQGFFLIEGGFLIAIETNTSVAEASLPDTNRIQIIRIDDKEMVLAPEEPPGLTLEPKPTVYSRQGK